MEVIDNVHKTSHCKKLISDLFMPMTANKIKTTFYSVKNYVSVIDPCFSWKY